ncbi:histidine kinase dimerization/phosphoacceptor domain -containing protein [Chitinophaga rhizophila]|uniref:histidine kinase n=1 Tax=Chitinophaga rhizophila TaxID=2866212 RepID=A0ABS7GLW6_9BACT|nr:histidine kinase dimerization/phosphoacceptor domain -containing protein [Chitinophaga rhizophila]MBW8688235.1 ATP-binding protein [Chitinophaga rhizophila]
MNRLLLLICCVIFYVLPCPAQEMPPTEHAALNVLLVKDKLNEEDIKILSDWGQHYINRPGIQQQDIDSARLCANRILKSGITQRIEKWQGAACMIYSQIYRETDEKTRGRDYAEKARKMFEHAGQDEQLGDAYVELSRYISYEDEEYLPEAISYQEKAVALYGKAGSDLKQAETLVLLADYVIGVPDMYKAIRLLHQAEAIYKRIGYKKPGRAYDLLGFAYKVTGEHNKALEYNLLALKEIEALRDTTQALSTCYNGLGMLYYEMEEFTKSVDAFNKAFFIASRLKDTVSMQYIAANTANSNIRMKNGREALRILKGMEADFPPAKGSTLRTMYAAMVHAYLSFNNTTGAIPYVRKLEELIRNTGYEDISRFYALTPVATFYFDTRQYEKALKACENIEHITRKYSMLAEMSRNYKMWYKVDSVMGNYPAAIKHFQDYKLYSDSLFSQRKSNQINQLQVKFDTEQKDNALKMKQQSIELLTRDGQLQKAELKRTRLTRNVIIAGAVMLILLLLLGYNRYQLRLRNNRQLKQQQDEINQQNHSLQALISSQHKLLEEKEWLMKEIHHRVKNNLQIVMSLLNTQAAFLNDADALTAIRESRFRMQAISLIHQKLYQSENMELIDMPVYIHDLVSNLRDGFSVSSKIRFDVQVAPVHLDVSQAVPIGLILNEAITNAIKYAFTGHGTITIALQRCDNNQLMLIIADNGQGFTINESRGNRKSMGMTLMHTLSEQLDGKIDIQHKDGVQVTITFNYDEAGQPHAAGTVKTADSYY